MFTVNDSGKHFICFKAKGERLEMSDLFQIVLSKRKGSEFFNSLNCIAHESYSMNRLNLYHQDLY